MRFAPPSGLGPVIAAVGLAAVGSRVFVAAVAGEPAPVRERIQFSSPGEPVDSPPTRFKEALPSRSFEFLDRGNSISGVVEPLVAPAPNPLSNYARNARLIALDRKKNWAYVRSDDFNRTQTTDEMLGVRDSGGSDKRPKSALERFFEDHGQKPIRARETPGEWNRISPKKDYGSSLDRGNRRETDADSRFDNPLDSTRRLAAGFAVPGDFFGNGQRADRANNYLNPRPENPFSSMRERQNRPDTFRPLLVVPGSLNPLVPGFDPINLQVDTTRQELNPVTAPRLGELPGVGGEALNLPRSFGLNRSGLPGNQSASVLGPSSLSPAVAAPSETPYVQPQPTVLEFPRRKF